MGKATFKFNGGNLALLCSNCRTIIKVGFQFTDEEKAAARGEIEMDRRYCGACSPKGVDNPDDIQPRPKKEDKRKDKEDPNELTFFN